MFDNAVGQERVILAGVALGPETETIQSLKELASLARTAGALVVETVIQSREAVHPATYLGSGKIEELRQIIYMTGATGVICDDELSPAQFRNLSDELDCKIMDRTLLILDIFASGAKTSEGRIQVELAQLRYRQSRLAGLGKALSRQGGGIGTRGPGEKKLETDRRLIGSRITVLKERLEEVKRHREILREGRKKSLLPVAAIVGYTNAGKSTLLNTMTGSDLYEEDALFATLDPATRLLDLECGKQVLLTDTVGFIDKLPHHLIEAFRSTLEEAAYSDLIIHVVDASSERMEVQMRVVYDTLSRLGVRDKPILTLFNKMDKRNEDSVLSDPNADLTLNISARGGADSGRVSAAIEKMLLQNQLYIERLYPYDQAGKIAIIRNKGTLISEEYKENGIEIRAYIPIEIYGAVDI